MAQKPTYSRQHKTINNKWTQGQIIEASLLNDMQDQIAQNTQGFSNIVSYSDTQPSGDYSQYNQIWLKKTRSAEDSIKLAEVKDLDKVVIVSQNQPNDNINKLWIKDSGPASQTITQVPSFDEFSQSIENNIAPSYLNSATYEVGEYVTYDNKLYMCQIAVTTPNEWNVNSNHFIEASVAGPLGYDDPTKGGWPNINASILNKIEEESDSRIQVQNKVNNIENSIAPIYINKTYNIGDYCTKDGYLYKCNTTINTAEAWTAAHWTQVTTGTELGDLKSAVGSLESYTGNSRDVCNMTIPGYILYADGTPETGSTAINDGYIYGNSFSVSQGAVISYKLRVPSRGCMIAFYSDQMVYDATKSVSGTGGPYEGTYIVPADGYVILSTRGDVADKYATYSINGELKTNIDDVDNKTVLLDEKIFSLVGAKTVSGFLKANGTVQENELYRTTDYLPVRNGQTIRYNLGHAVALPVLCFYTSKNAGSVDTTKTITGVNGYVSGTFTAAANGYIRVTFYATKMESALDFTPYIPDNVINYINNNVQTSILSNKSILCLGDSIFGNDGEIVVDIHTLTGANSVNGAFGGTRVTDRGSGDFRYFDGVQLVSALCSQTWTNQDAAAESLESSYPWITSRLATLKAVDMSEIDIITMDWGTNDYAAGATIEQITAAYNDVIDAIQEEYPTIRILIITPIWRYFGTKADNQNGDNKVFNVSTLKEIASAIDANSKEKRIESLQMYQKMPLSYNTADTYFDANDSTHLNANGNLVYAHILAGKLRSMF